MGVEIVKPLCATPIGRKDGRRIWRLTDDYVLLIDGKEVFIPYGFQTDYASVPRGPLLYMLFGDTAHEAAVAHDYGYRYDAGQVDKGVVDGWFLKIMESQDEPPQWWKRRLMYWAVCWFANGSWHKLSVKDKLI